MLGEWTVAPHFRRRTLLRIGQRLQIKLRMGLLMLEGLRPPLSNSWGLRQVKLQVTSRHRISRRRQNQSRRHRRR